jgi:hypothetical protein
MAFFIAFSLRRVRKIEISGSAPILPVTIVPYIVPELRQFVFCRSGRAKRNPTIFSRAVDDVVV